MNKTYKYGKRELNTHLFFVIGICVYLFACCEMTMMMTEMVGLMEILIHWDFLCDVCALVCVCVCTDLGVCYCPPAGGSGRGLAEWLGTTLHAIRRWRESDCGLGKKIKM